MGLFLFFVLLFTVLIAVIIRVALSALIRHEGAIVGGSGALRFVVKEFGFEFAEAAARERRRSIERLLGEFELPRQFSREAVLRPLPIEFLEVPEGMEPRRHEMDSGAGSAELARLYWELEDDSLLVLGRVADLVTNARRALSSEKLDDGLVVRLSGAGRKPFVIVETDMPWLYADALAQHSRWLGVPVALAPSPRPELLGRCSVGGESDGVVGGAVKVNGDEFGLTCDHVLSQACGSVASRPSPRTAGEPDAALIRPGADCFDFPVPTAGRCSAASVSEVSKLIFRNGTVVLRRNGRPGNALTRSYDFAINGREYRFPHVEVGPQRRGFEAFLPQAMARRFSRAGDSGSWVFDARSGEWVGLLVGGAALVQVSYVAEATPLLIYLAAKLGTSVNAIELRA
jgi:hypothetical protein